MRQTWHNLYRKIVLLVHRTFASSLIEDIEHLQDNYRTMLKAYIGANAEIQEQKKQIRELRQEIETLRGTDPLGRSINSARAHASKQRILDLEAQVRHLGGEPQ